MQRGKRDNEMCYVCQWDANDKIGRSLPRRSNNDIEMGVWTVGRERRKGEKSQSGDDDYGGSY